MSPLQLNETICFCERYFYGNDLKRSLVLPYSEHKCQCYSINSVWFLKLYTTSQDMDARWTATPGRIYIYSIMVVRIKNKKPCKTIQAELQGHVTFWWHFLKSHLESLWGFVVVNNNKYSIRWVRVTVTLFLSFLFNFFKFCFCSGEMWK